MIGFHCVYPWDPKRWVSWIKFTLSSTWTWRTFLDQLYDRTTDENYDKNTRFNVTYSLLKGLSGKPYFKACTKHYLSSQIRSKFAIVDGADWEIAIFLPTESFKKASLDSVWKESRKKIS